MKTSEEEGKKFGRAGAQVEFARLDSLAPCSNIQYDPGASARELHFNFNFNFDHTRQRLSFGEVAAGDRNVLTTSK
jgi:hypothetical protein